jgi:hypothetical protein
MTMVGRAPDRRQVNTKGSTWYSINPADLLNGTTRKLVNSEQSGRCIFYARRRR